MLEWTNSCRSLGPKQHAQTDHFNLTKHTRTVRRTAGTSRSARPCRPRCGVPRPRSTRAPGRKPACAVTGAHASRAYPSDSARCRSRHRLTQRRSDGYEPSNPWLAQPLPHPHGGMPLLAREPGTGGRPPLDDLSVPRIDRRPASPAGRTREEILPRGVPPPPSSRTHAAHARSARGSCPVPPTA